MTADWSAGWSAGPFAELLETLPDGVVVLATDGRIVAVNAQTCALSGYVPEQLVDAPVEMLVPSHMRAEHVALRSAYVAEGGSLRPMSQRLDIVLMTADRKEVPVDIALSTIKLDDEKYVIATVRDASVRREAEIAIEHERALLTAMNQISIALLEGHNLDDTFRGIVRLARTLVRADYVILTTPDDDGSALVMRVVEGDGIAALEGSAVPLDSSMAGQVLRDREPQLLVDSSRDPRMFRPAGWPADAGPALFVPMHAGSEILGSLTVVNRQGRNLFTIADITRIRAFAAHAAVALENARRQEALNRVTVLDEDRERVALAVHDTVIGRVSSVSLRLHGLLHDDVSPEVSARLWESIDELDAAIRAIRDAVFPAELTTRTVALRPGTPARRDAPAGT
ncbi:MAG TPA: GAF domain-containing protein [Acidimicrobiia bacterium]|nr:GAF domain-containing protein [Acidimicrobiia bacterium]